MAITNEFYGIALLWVAYVLMFLLAMAPMLFFVVRTYPRREAEILSTFSSRPENGLVLSYLETVCRFLPHLDTPHSLDTLKAAFRARFGPATFVFPILLLMVTCVVALLLPLLFGIRWIAGESMAQFWVPVEAVVAILGAWMWIVVDQIDRAWNGRLTTFDLYFSSFLLVIAYPMAHSLSILGNASLSIPLAFLFGTFPTGTIMTLGRTLVQGAFNATGLGDAPSSTLTVLPSIDSWNAERLGTIGITNIAALAYEDPILIAMKTGLSCTYVMTCCAETLLYFYRPVAAALWRGYGISSCVEVYQLSERLRQTPPDPTAVAIVNDLAIATGTTPVGVTNAIRRIARDAYAGFQRAWW